MTNPRLSDIQSKPKFKAGDRLISVVSCDLTEDQHRKMVRAIVKFAGVDVRVLIFNNIGGYLAKFRGSGLSAQLLVSSSQVVGTPVLGVAHVECCKVDVAAGDQLLVSCPQERKVRTLKEVAEWAGKDVEVVG